MFEYKIKNKEKIFEMLQITIGVVLVAIGFYFFYKPRHLVTGGVSGTSIIFQNITKVGDFGSAMFIFIANLLLLIIGGLVLGKAFFFKTIYGSLLLPALIALLAIFPSDLLINAIRKGSEQINSNEIIIISTMGSIITGLGLGLVFKNNATTGGTDVIQRILHEKLKVPFSVAIYLTDGVIIAIGLFVFDVESTYFAVVALVIAGIVVDKVMLSGKSGYTVFIVTTNFKEVKNAIYHTINRGVTKVNVEGGYSESGKEMLICTISKNQLYHVKGIIHETDPEAFTFITKTTESVGQGF